jgi:hypothetical protein
MVKTRTYLMGFAVAVALVSGVLVRPADAASLACPQLCLTGGGVLGGASSASVSNVAASDGVSAADNGMETRTYDFTWYAVDGTSTVPAKVIDVHIVVAGHGGDSFSGSGTAYLTGPGGSTLSLPVSVTDNGLLLTASGGGFTLNAVLSSIGEATLFSSEDPGWDNPPGEDDCDGHENDDPIGHVLGRGGGHDCD